MKKTWLQTQEEKFLKQVKKEMVILHGGKRPNAGRKKKYGEETQTISFRVPVEWVDVIKSTVKAKVAELSKKNKNDTVVNPTLSKAVLGEVLWDIEYHLNADRTSRKLTAQLWGKTMDEVRDKFKSWHPETYIWRVQKNSA